MVAQFVDLAALLPVGRLADRLGRAPVLGVVIVVLGLGTAAVGLGSFPWFVAGCACFGFGLAGWMLPVGIIREHTRPEALAWRMGLYRVGSMPRCSSGHSRAVSSARRTRESS
jgi:MFS family permease